MITGKLANSGAALGIGDAGHIDAAAELQRNVGAPEAEGRLYLGYALPAHVDDADADGRTVSSAHHEAAQQIAH